MRFAALQLLLLAALNFSSCNRAAKTLRPPAKFTEAFWFWQGSSAYARATNTVLDVLFVEVGTIRQDQTPPYARQPGWTPASEPWRIFGDWPNELPGAHEYWLVFRYERQGVPAIDAASLVAEEAARLRDIAEQQHCKVVGVQLDIDSPTHDLPQYVAFLHHVRSALPRDMEISITALLDWFRPGTSIRAVIKETDEFVPQFYDAADLRVHRNGQVIAAKLDPGQWAPVFNTLGKRFRIGISTFGRARLARREAPQPPRYRGISYYFADLTPLDIATNPAFQLDASHSDTGELVLSYRASQAMKLGHNNLEEADALQFIVSTPDSVRAAVESARKIGGSLAGVVFFRWPAANETLAMQPDEVLAAAGFTDQNRPKRPGVLAVDKACAAVKCVDLFLENARPYSPRAVTYRVRSSTDLEYFLPEAKTPVRMSGPAAIELRLPPYCARGLMYLGRAVSLKPAGFSVDEAQ